LRYVLRRIPILILATVFPWFFLTFVIPITGRFIYMKTRDLFGVEIQLLRYIFVGFVFLLFLFLWYTVAVLYLKTMLKRVSAE